MIRIASPRDAPEIARLNRLFNGVEAEPADYAARLADPRRVDTVLLGEVEGYIAGIACLRLAPTVFYDGPYAELTELFVEEPYRRRGLASRLITHAEHLAQAAGAKQMLILTDFYNHPAQQLYRSLGYVHHDVVLSKDLTYRRTEP